MTDKNESRRNRHYGNFKEPKRPTILMKKDDNRDSVHKSESITGPKILLKSKEHQEPIAPIVAVREHRDTKQNVSTSSPGRTIMSKEVVAPIVVEPSVAHPNIINLPTMTKPHDLITLNLTLNAHCFDFLSETNTLFHVIGVIGARGVGKSTIMNLLTTQEHNSNDGGGGDYGAENSIENQIFTVKEGIFPMHDFILSSSAVDSIKMYVTRDRKILLDCSPVLANLANKDSIMNEIDDLRLIIFLLSVCHLVIVVQEDYFNLNFIRLIQNAEMMKPNFSKNGEAEHLANIMFIKNFASRVDFTRDSQNTLNRMYKTCFKNSRLRIYSGCYPQSDPLQKHNSNANTFIFPKIDLTRKLPYYGHPMPAQIINDLRQLIFMSPRNTMVNLATPFTEKVWAQLVANVWDSHKNNYFLRKYENLKEKPNHFHGRDREFENSNNKERYYDY